MSRIRVMSFNVFSPGELEDGDELPPEELPNAWPDRAPLILRTIRKYQPDLIGFQELDGAKLDHYRDELPDYGFDDRLDVPSILWHRDRVAAAESGRFWLSRTPDEASSDWGVPYPLSVDWASVRLLDGGTELLFLNTQFEDGPDGALSRLESSKLIVQRVVELQAAHPIPVVLSGDFNCNPWHPPYQVFVDHGFVDTYRAAGHGDGAASSTFHGFRGAAYVALEYGVEVFWRVDWIMIRAGAQPIRTTSCTIVRDAEPPVYPSDHYPLVAEMLLGA